MTTYLTMWRGSPFFILLNIYETTRWNQKKPLKKKKSGFMETFVLQLPSSTRSISRLLEVLEKVQNPCFCENYSYRTKLYFTNLLSCSSTRLLTSLLLLQWSSYNGAWVSAKDTPMLKLALMMSGIQIIF